MNKKVDILFKILMTSVVFGVAICLIAAQLNWIIILDISGIVLYIVAASLFLMIVWIA